MAGNGVLTAVIAAMLAGPASVAETAAQGQETAAPVNLYGVAPKDPSVEGAASADHVVPAAVDRKGTEGKRGEFVIAPMPMINPTLDNGLSVVVGYLYRLDRTDLTTPPSLTMLGGFKTSNGSWAGSLLQSLHLKADRIRILAALAYSDVNYDFYGIGQSAGNAGLSIELNQAGPVGLTDVLFRVAPGWYAGARYQFMDMSASTADIPLPDGPVLPGIDADLRTAALGPRLEFDSRDSAFYPTRGAQANVIASFYGSAVGGTRTYQQYQASLNSYHPVSARNVLAWHAGLCGTEGSVPFYDLCLLGKNQDLRGYPMGQYRDRKMVAAQAEWRSELFWRFGGAVFAGIGEVAAGFDKLTWDDLLPGAGVGLRFTLAKRNHVNLRVDYAWGKGSRALYVGVAEAF